MRLTARFTRPSTTHIGDRAWRLWAGNCSLHRSMYEKVGPYDQSFRQYGWEDTDYGYRLLTCGAAVRLDRTRDIHRSPSVTTAIRAERAFRSGQARARFVRKHGVDPDVVVADLRLRVRSWSALIRAFAVGRTSGHYRAAGAAVDRILPSVPDAARSAIGGSHGRSGGTGWVPQPPPGCNWPRVSSAKRR